MMYKNIKKFALENKDKGAVSLFVVIFAAFLFVAVTVGFIVLMSSDQNRATDNDLSQSARDSAEAGIEEAKRVLAQLELCNQQNLAEADPAMQGDCERISAAVRSGECNTVRRALGMTDNDETLVAKDPTDAQLEQAFTCVKINPDTLSYEGRLDGEADMRVVPIRAVSDVSRIKISWTRDDATLVNSADEISPSFDSLGIDIPGLNSENERYEWELAPPKMPEKSEWNSYGSILRVGSYQYPSGEMDLTLIDNSSRTAFLYPTTSGPGSVSTEDGFRMDVADRHSHPAYDGTDETRLTPLDGPNVPQNIRCEEPGSSDSGDFLCSTIIELPEPIPSSSSNMRTYMTLSAIYNSTDFKIELIGSDGEVVRFQNVQPEIDSTGRANNVLRRLVARVESADASRAPYPRAALGSANSICKSYMITDSAAEYTDTRNFDSCPDVTNPGSPW